MLGQGADRLRTKLADRANALVAAPSRKREHPLQFPVRVHAVDELSRWQRRVTLFAPELADYAVTGPDEYFGLLIPHPVAGLVMPEADRLNTRQAVQRVPEDRRPGLRWYTVRRHRPALGEVDVDFVVHEHDGPGSTWGAGARVGDVAGFRAGGSGYQAPEGPQVLVADEAALPALSAVLESLPAEVPPLRVYLEADPEFKVPEIVSAVQPVVLPRLGEPGEAVLGALAAAPPVSPVFAWVCGEAGLAARVRRFLLAECGMDRGQVMFSGYWKQGQPRG